MNSELLLIGLFISFAIGAIIVLRNSPTYGDRSIPGLFAGWIFIIASWAVIFLEKETYSIIAITRGALVIMGILAGLIAVFIGVHLAERSSGLRDESEPLSKEEGDLVRAILERRLGGILE